ncbi:serine kinase/phosphatase [Halopseudomonas sabulinigri]|uniref:Phosphotransferase system, HPr-related protein n=1 Tax=Halopseudomonas sabulinigri TaxID=472181 RepID=A0ABP9ZT84_9GAMM
MKARDEKRDPERTNERMSITEDSNEVSAADDRPMGPIGKVPSAEEAINRAAQGGLTQAAQPGEGPTMDDATPETLMPEDGARSPQEAAQSDTPADQDLSNVDVDEIGAGSGLDEAELGRVKPLDGKPWSETDDSQQ